MTFFKGMVKVSDATFDHLDDDQLTAVNKFIKVWEEEFTHLDRVNVYNQIFMLRLFTIKFYIRDQIKKLVKEEDAEELEMIGTIAPNDVRYILIHLSNYAERMTYYVQSKAGTSIRPAMAYDEFQLPMAILCYILHNSYSASMLDVLKNLVNCQDWEHDAVMQATKNLVEIFY